MDINHLTLESIKNYYKVLEDTGYIEDNQMYKLLLLSFINDLFSEEYSWYITEKDYALLTGIINCISKNTCIIPYNNISTHTEPIKNYLEDTPTRISENEIIRLDTSDVLRIANL